MHYTPPAIKQNVTLVRDLYDGCDFRTINPHSLKTHKKINHDEDTKFNCDICDYTGITTYCVKYHKEVNHAKIRYACDQCDFEATGGFNLNIHKRTLHFDNDKSIICDQCNYRTNYLGAQEAHQRVKHDGRKYCALCVFL